MGIFSKRKGEKTSPPAGLPSSGIPSAPSIPAAPAPSIGVSNVRRVPWDGSKFRIQLKMAKNRLDIQRGKKDNELAAIRRVIAGHLSEKKEPLARIQAERVLREHTQIIAFDILNTCIDLLVSSGNAFSSTDFNQLPGDVKQAVASTLYASGRVNVPELLTVCNMLRNHFSAHITDPIGRMEGENIIYINKLLAQKLSGTPPDGHLILKELCQIAEDYNVKWTPPPEESDLNNFDYNSSTTNLPPGFGMGGAGGGGGMHTALPLGHNTGGGLNGGNGRFPFSNQPSAPEASDFVPGSNFHASNSGFSQGFNMMQSFSESGSQPPPPPPPQLFHGAPSSFPAPPGFAYPPSNVGIAGAPSDSPGASSLNYSDLEAKFQQMRTRRDNPDL